MTVRSRFLARSKALSGIDIHVAFTLLLRGWSLLAGALSIFLIPYFLSPIEQGYYYTFASILALQIFFELGMGQVVIQIVAHEAAHLRLGKNGNYEGPAESLARLTVLRLVLSRWYLPAALLFAIIVCGAGLIFFRNGEISWSQWAPPWVLLVGATAVNLFLSWRMSMVEGFALVREVAQLRLCQSITGYLLMWGGLIAGAGLWVVVALPATALVITAYWLRFGPAAAVLGIYSANAPSQPIRWKSDILPLQWRIAVSWICGYFVLNLFTPLLFKQSGAVEAGRLGLAMTVFSAISMIGMSWVTAKSPNFSMLIARRQSRELLALFKRVSWRSLAMTAILSAAFIAGAILSSAIGVHQMQRIASLPVMACLAWVTVVNCAFFAAAIFMRAHREEPMLPVSITSGLLVALAAWLGSSHGAFMMIAGYTIVTTLVSLPWTLWILRSYLARHEGSGDVSLPSTNSPKH
jgi:hypothetical protein